MAQSKSKENLLILGATGYIGTYITEQIVKSKDHFGRIAIFTSPKTAQSKAQTLDKLRAQGVEVIIGEVENSEDLLNAFKGLNTSINCMEILLIHAGIDTVISAAGRNVIADQINWIKLAVQAPTVKRFFPSEYGTDVDYGPESVNEVPHQQKLKVRTGLRA
jgi:nucleoside-diphosphate-sugar epimerase